MKRVVVSPYHLTHRDPAAMAALLLAESVCVPLLAPVDESRDSVRAALASTPAYERLLNNWLALAPLFEAGVIQTLEGGADPYDAIRTATGDIGGCGVSNRSALGSMCVQSPLIERTQECFECVAIDTLKGGPDPGIAVPMIAGEDAFAVEHDCAVVRAGVSDGRGSLVQQVESRLGGTLVTVGVPFMKQASGAMILEARSLLAREIGVLRDAFAACERGGTAKSARDAAGAFTMVFKERLAHALQRDDESGRRVVPGFVSISLRVMPRDAAVVSARIALGEKTHEAVPSEDRSLRVFVVTALDVAPM